MPQITMRRGLWHAACRHATREAAEMSQDRAWVYTSLRQDYLSLARVAKAVLDANPVQGPFNPDEELTTDAPESVLSTLEVEQFIEGAP